MTLVALTGSEKQVAWAEEIRREKLAALGALKERAIAEFIRNMAGDATAEDIADVAADYDQSAARLAAQAVAAWWIDRRGQQPWERTK